jgi:retinol-binding protein 3
MLIRILSICVLAAGISAGQVTVPDTPAGRTLRAWLESFNSGDRSKIEAFGSKFQGGRPADEVMEFRQQTGGFELLAIDRSEPLRIVFRVKERSSPTTANGEITVREGDPAVIQEFSLRAAPVGAVPAGPEVKLDAAARGRVIEGAIAKLEEFYVFPDKAKAMGEAVEARLKRGEYDKVESGGEFARLLTEHLREVSRDKHLRVNYSPSAIPQRERSAPGAEERARYRREMERINCGFEKAERLASNIGYLKFNMFADPEVCGQTAVAAMNFLSGVNAIIFDLRQNGGGDPAMIALISSYLFDEQTHLNDLYNRKEDKTTQYWTLPYVPGKKLAGKPVFVLTSARTFSGAEEFSYNLKNLKRGTIIGETTGGGAHPVSGHRIDDHFMIGVPFARAVNPISKTNWEGVGVEPDVKAPAGEALEVAKKMAAEALRASVVNSDFVTFSTPQPQQNTLY